MCGRYYLAIEDTPVFARLREKINQSAMFEYASDEIFPTSKVLVMLPEEDDYHVDIMRWGVEGYHKRALINARSETVYEKKTFSGMVHKRCLIPCNGFYEWIRNGSHKEKIYIQRDDTPLFYLAGIYNENKEFVIVTGEAQHEMKAVHDRTPIIIMEDQIEDYLQERLSFHVDNEHLTFTNLERHKRKDERQLSLFDEKEEGKM